MILYTLIFIAIVFLGMIDNYIEDDLESIRFKNILTIVILIFLSFVSGTRLIGGSDYKFYLKSYHYVPIMSEVLAGTKINGNFFTAGFDYGYLFLTSACKSIGITFHGFTLIHSFFFNFAMYFGIRRYCKRFSTVLLVYISKLFFYNTFISMRQSITIAIFFLALPLIENKEFIKYLIVCLICFFMHSGSIIMLPIYFVNKVHINKQVIIIFLAILSPFAIVNALQIDFVTPFIHSLGNLLSGVNIGQKFLNYSSGEAISPIYLIEYWLISIMVIYNYDEIIKINKSEFVIKLFLILYLFFTLFGGISVITREKDYLILTYAILLEYLMIIKDCHYRSVILIILYLISGAEYFRYIIAFDNSSLLNYSSWLYNLFKY